MNTLPVLTKNDTEMPPHILKREFEELLKIKMPHHHRLLIQIMWETGARVSDVCGLMLTDFNFDKRELRLRVQKTRRRVNISLSNALTADILNYCLQNQIQDKIFSFGRGNVQKFLKQYGSQIGMSHIHPHMFRHGHAIHGLMQGIPIQVVSARLGHSNILTTMNLYQKITPEIQKKFYENAEF